MNIYIELLGLACLISAIIAIVWYLTFSVPLGTKERLNWLWENKKPWMIAYLILIAFIIVVCIIMFTHPCITRSVAPFSQSGVFLYASSVLLTANFFITPESNANGTYDTHPLVFYTVLFLLTMGLIAGCVDTGKLYKMHKLECSKQ